MFFKLSQLWLGLHLVVMIVNIDLSQEIFAINMLRALKSYLKHRHKHVLRPLNYMETRLNPIPHGEGGGADSALLQIVFFITSFRDAAEPRILVTFLKFNGQ